MKSLLGLFLTLASLQAQLIPTGGAVPKRAKLPVVFLNGYQNDCTGSSFAGTFGTADEVLAANGQSSLFFDNCRVAGHPGIELLGREFGKFLASLKYDDGTAVDTVDVVAHSMGGLIVRSYLSGKDPAGAIFQPPAETRIRKTVFLATPHFGTGITAVLAGGKADDQVVELASGSRFLFDLGTWNQGTDDLRGVDALSVLGNAGTGSGILGLGSGQPRLDDGVVTLTSGSLLFYMPGRTRVLPFCHTEPGLITLAQLCPAGAKGIAALGATDPARIVVSFLNGTDEWKSIGAAAEDNEYLTTNTGLEVMVRTADDKVAAIDSVTAASKGTTKKLNTPTREVAYTDLLPAGAVATEAVASGVSVQKSLGISAGGYAAVTMKPGPFVSRMLPAAAALLSPLSVAPGEIVAVYGDGLGQSQILVNGQPIPLIASSPSQVNAILPAGLAGLVKVMAKDTTGSHTINAWVEAAVPAIFTQNMSGQGPASALNALTNVLVTPANPLRAGDYVSLYLTGLGATAPSGGLEWAQQQPTVTVGGKACAVSYAGRAPGYPGLDQINCQVASGITAGDAAVVVTSGKRVSNVATLAVQ